MSVVLDTVHYILLIHRRFRPDIRRLENNDLDGAAAEKTRLEEKQREVRSLRKRKKIPEWHPRYCVTPPPPHMNH